MRGAPGGMMLPAARCSRSLRARARGGALPRMSGPTRKSCFCLCLGAPRTVSTSSSFFARGVVRVCPASPSLCSPLAGACLGSDDRSRLKPLLVALGISGASSLPVFARCSRDLYASGVGACGAAYTRAPADIEQERHAPPRPMSTRKHTGTAMAVYAIHITCALRARVHIHATSDSRRRGTAFPPAPELGVWHSPATRRAHSTNHRRRTCSAREHRSPAAAPL